MTYDKWKATNPADQWLGPAPRLSYPGEAAMATIMIFVDEEQNIVRLLGQRPTDQTLANIAAATMQEIIRGSMSEASKERAAEVLKALGVTRVEEIPSN